MKFQTSNKIIASLVIICFLISTQLYAAERTLIVDAMQTGDFAVGSSNFTINNVKASGVDAGIYLQGGQQGSDLLYINSLLEFEQDTFTFQLSVPNDSLTYGSMAGKSLPYSGYVLYPTSSSNTRANYSVFTVPPALPHMQGKGDAPIFANASTKYPLLVYSHGNGSHPTADVLEALIKFASHGYIVMALYHGDGRFSETDASNFTLRPLAVKTAIDKILADANFSSHIDTNRIGGMGESYGGATMLALLGAKVIYPEPSSVFLNTLRNTTVDSRIKAAATYVPYMGKDFYSNFGNKSTGTQSVDKPFMANSSNSDEQTDYTKVQLGIANIPGIKYLVEYDAELHGMSAGAQQDTYTWIKIFLDAYIKEDAEAIDVLSRIKSVNASGKDSLVVFPEEAISSPTSTPDVETHAVYEGTKLTIPAVDVAGVIYRAELELIENTNPFEFLLVSAVEITDLSASASFKDGLVSIPIVKVGNSSFAVELMLTSDAPIQFVLKKAVLIE